MYDSLLKLDDDGAIGAAGETFEMALRTLDDLTSISSSTNTCDTRPLGRVVAAVASAAVAIASPGSVWEGP